MNGLVDACKRDWFALVLDFVGFAPSRFYLRETCSALYGSVPAELYVSMYEFVVALEQRLIGPKNLFLDPKCELDSDLIGRVVKIWRSEPSRKVKKLLLERTLLKWDSALVSSCAASEDLRAIEFDAWLFEDTDILEKVMDCRKYVKDRNEVHRSYLEYMNCGANLVVNDLDFCKRLLSDWARPQDEDEWRDLLRIVLLKEAQRDAFDYLVAESGLDIMDDGLLLLFLARTNFVDLVEQCLESHPVDDEYERVEIDNAIYWAIAYRREAMIKYLVDRFGCYGGICCDWLDDNGRGPPEIGILDLLLSRGANINGRSEDSGTCLAIALRNGYWDLVDAIMKRGGKIGLAVSALKGPACQDVGLFRKYLAPNGCLKGLVDVDLLRFACTSNCSCDVLTEIFDIVFAKNPSVVQDAFDLTMLWASKPEFPNYVPFLQKLIAINPSLVQRSHDGNILPIGVCAVYEPLRRLKWDGRDEEGRRIGSRYFPLESVHASGESRLLNEWYDAEPDPIRVASIADLRKTLIEYGADPDRWYVDS